ncbi:hypothetical protein FRB96_000864 [Tulasnella sp. 330]|nr:hypothetical protein FRB96_000864 [Tulasnella sp. 330]KAG8888211.1 hypothetical protein FRB98_008151 [Tulasnella sp. 332]
MTDAQTEALAQVQAITGGEDSERDRAVLESVGWNVEKAVQAIFDQADTPSQPVASSSRSRSPTMSRSYEQMEFEDFPLPGPPSRASSTPSAPPVARLGLGFLSFLTYPFTLSFSLMTNIIQYVFRILRIPFPRFRSTSISLRPPTAGRPPRSGNPRDAAERWVRELEDETGAMSVTRAAVTATTTARTEKDASEGSELRQREKSDSKGRLLPDFWLGSYESALKAAQSEAKMICVVIVSEEHDDTAEFKRNVLTDPDLVRTLTDNDFIVWGGDVRDSEAYQTALKLSATTYPFVAFVSLHPRAGARGTGSGSPQMSVISRHSGSPSTGTSAAALHAYITTTLVPRVTPLLNRLRAEIRMRQQERELRAEQDRAFAEAERMDRERMAKRREEELRIKREDEERQKKEEEQWMREQWREQWRQHVHANLTPEPGPETRGRLRIGIRLPNGQRLVRFFKPDENIEALYTWADTGFLASPSAHGEPASLPPADYKPEFEFSLASSFPREEVPLIEGKILGDVNALKGGANLVVEMKAGYGSRSHNGTDEGSSDEESSDEDGA